MEETTGVSPRDTTCKAIGTVLGIGNDIALGLPLELALGLGLPLGLASVLASGFLSSRFAACRRWVARC